MVGLSSIVPFKDNGKAATWRARAVFQSETRFRRESGEISGIDLRFEVLAMPLLVVQGWRSVHSATRVSFRQRRCKRAQVLYICRHGRQPI